MEFPLLGYGKPGIFHAENTVFADSTPSRSTSACATARLASSSSRGVATDSIFVPHTPACATLAVLPTGGRSDSRGPSGRQPTKNGTPQTPLVAPRSLTGSSAKTCAAACEIPDRSSRALHPRSDPGMIPKPGAVRRLEIHGRRTGFSPAGRVVAPFGQGTVSFWRSRPSAGQCAGRFRTAWVRAGRPPGASRWRPVTLRA